MVFLLFHQWLFSLWWGGYNDSGNPCIIHQVIIKADFEPLFLRGLFTWVSGDLDFLKKKTSLASVYFSLKRPSNRAWKVRDIQNYTHVCICMCVSECMFRSVLSVQVQMCVCSVICVFMCVMSLCAWYWWELLLGNHSLFVWIKWHKIVFQKCTLILEFSLR